MISLPTRLAVTVLLIAAPTTPASPQEHPPGQEEIDAPSPPSSSDKPDGDRGTGTEAQLDLMTFNLRFASTDSPNAWTERREACFRLLRDHSPDLIATQEGLFGQLKDIDLVLSDHDRIGVGRDGGSHGEFMAVYYRRDRLEALEYDHFWLSPNPRLIGSKSFDADLPRMLTWVRFQDRRTGKTFLLANTHLDHAHARARRQSTALIRSWAAKIRPDVPLILAGDFNAAAVRNPIYQELVNEKTFVDTFVSADEAADEHGTFHGFRGGDAGRGRIDWILARGPIRTLRSGMVFDSLNGQFPSDHYPVTATIEITSPPPTPPEPPADASSIPTRPAETDRGGNGGFR